MFALQKIMHMKILTYRIIKSQNSLGWKDPLEAI